MQKSERNYWPHAIIGSIILIAIACVVTVVIALKNAPVEFDTFYFDSYENVDKNINKIEAMQKIFDKKYDVSFLNTSNLHVGENNKVNFQIFDKNGNKIENAKVKMLLTKPETNKLNQEIDSPSFNENSYELTPLNISQLGRWIIQLKIQIDEDIGFFSKDIYVKK